jgi:hypothetical protein
MRVLPKFDYMWLKLSALLILSATGVCSQAGSGLPTCILFSEPPPKEDWI